MKELLSSLVEALPPSAAYFARRARFMTADQERFRKFQELRAGSSREGYTLKPFDDLQCIFIHIPKCAGQSIRASLFSDLQPGHITLYTYQLVFPRRLFKRYFKFAFIRNPWDRLASAYMFMRSGGAHHKDREWAEAHLAPYSDFSSFVREGLRQDHILRWPHFRPQSDFLRGQSGGIEADFLGRFENLAEDFRLVSDRLGLDRELMFVNKTTTKRDPYQTYYTDEAREIAGAVYQEDIQAFGYQF